MRNTKRSIYQGVIIYCVIFSAATIVSSLIQLMGGTENDSNYHIILRGLITLIGVTAFWMSWRANFKFKVLNVAVPYCVSLAIVFCTVFFSGFFVELHPNAYRDVFLNYTAVFAIVTAIVRLAVYFKNRKRTTKES
jgi:hypothetical protein